MHYPQLTSLQGIAFAQISDLFYSFYWYSAEVAYVVAQKHCSPRVNNIQTRETNTRKNKDYRRMEKKQGVGGAQGKEN